jgi:EAL domain-containing protein (putative c-di-GMP-specific phosphodiesterase class I)
MLSTLEHDEIALHYQPLARRGGHIAGMEALMRWHHRRRGAISPEAFIPIFEDSGIIVPLSQWALGEAAREAATWRAPLTVAVNLSAKQFEQDDLPALVTNVLARSGLAPERLELEVGEAALSGDRDVRATLTRLRDLGVGIALADFGAGRTGPSYIREFPFSKVKIARSLVAEVGTSAPARSIVHMIVSLAHALGLSVAAEGVETDAQRTLLEAEGCDWLQGYLIGRPGPIEDHAISTGTNAVAPWVGAAKRQRGGVGEVVPTPPLLRIA